MATEVLEQPAGRPRADALERPPTRRMVSAAVGTAALVTAGVAGLTLAVDSAAGPSFVVRAAERPWPSWLGGPLSDLGGTVLTGPTYFRLTFGMLVAYAVVVACSRSIGARAAVVAVVGLHLAFALTPPVGSTDIFNYVAYARMGVLHGLSPYAHTPAAIISDPAFRWVTWPDWRSPYGPLYTLASYVTAPLGLGAALWAFKAMAAAAALGCLALVWDCARRLGRDPVPPLLLVGLNPGWVVWGVGGGHNDFLMALPMLGALALWLRGRQTAAIVMAVVAVGVKAPAALLVALMVGAARERGRALAAAAGATAGLGVVSLVAFGSLESLTSFRRQGDMHTNRSILGQVALQFDPQATPQWRGPATVAVVVALALALWAVWRGGDLIRAAAWTMAVVVAALLWEFPWYVVWVVPLAALARDRRLDLVVVVFTGVLLM